MPHPARSSLAALALLSVLAFGATGCGEDGGGGEIPDDAVAVVGDQAITKDEFDHWFAYTLDERTQEQVPLDPPRFAKCVAEMTKRAEQQRPTSKKERRTYTAPRPLELCRDDYRTDIEQTMPFLLEAEWVQQMAAELDIDVEDEEAIDLVFEERKDYEEHLKSTKVSREDTGFRIRIKALEKKMQKTATETDKAISDEDVKAYHAANEELYYGQPLEGLETTIRAKLFTERFSRDYRAKTRCAKGYVVSMCANGPRLATPAGS